MWENVKCPPGPISLHQDCNVYVSESDPNTSFELALGKGRQAYLLCIEGAPLAHSWLHNVPYDSGIGAGACARGATSLDFMCLYPV